MTARSGTRTNIIRLLDKEPVRLVGRPESAASSYLAANSGYPGRLHQAASRLNGSGGIVGKTAVKFNIPEVEAVERLKDLIREHGKWIDAAPQGSALETVS
jgi:hypothetical protein